VFRLKASSAQNAGSLKCVLDPFELAQAVVDHVDLDQQRRAAYHEGIGTDDALQPFPGAGQRQCKQQRHHGADGDRRGQQPQRGQHALAIHGQAFRAKDDFPVHYISIRLVPRL
jgi:hypothetical protein